MSVLVGMARVGKLAAASAVLCLESARHSRVSRAGLGRARATSDDRPSQPHDALHELANCGASSV